MTRNLAPSIPVILLSALAPAHPALATDSVLVGWGFNADGQSTIPPGLGVIVQIAAGEAHSVVLRADGTVYCWGWNPYGQCDVPAGLPPIRRIDAGYNGTIALGWDGRVRCWGANANGECNVPTTLENVVQVAGGGYHNVALRSDGVIVGWGWNGVGQITTPAGIGPVKAIGAGHAHTIAIREDGTVWCWGRNDSLECDVPANVAGVIEASSGGFNSIARGANGTTFAWGNPGWGLATVPPAAAVSKQVAGGHYHNLVLRPDGNVVAWGGNWEGQGTVPTGVTNVAYIAAGGYHNLALIAADEDGDGIDNTVDNCVFTANPSQSDIDSDGIGDACDFLDCNGDGLDDAIQCRNGTLADFNSNNIPDCCESGSSCVTGNYPVQWRTSDGGNGHWYQRIPTSCWNEGNSYAVTRGIHLASLTSVAEAQFCARLFPSNNYWITAKVGGIRTPESDLFTGWTWTDGEPFVPGTLPWMAANPGCCFPNEYYLGINHLGQIGDLNDCDDGGGGGAIIEWSADCNGDGIVDIGQILSGALSDSDADGIPDCCDGGVLIRVPQDFKTIQAAIAATDIGCAARIEVAAGNYSGPINLGGRNIQLVGSGPDSCTISGLGATPSSVVLGTAEPSSALLEGFTIRDGATGSPLPAQPDALCGGGMLLVESALRVRNCRFISNEAVFGGGAYLYRSSAVFEQCTFSENLAQARSGGADVFECSATFVNCEFRANQAAIGAGVQVYRGQSVFEGTTIHLNGAFDVGGGIQWYPVDDTSLLTLRNCSILSNTATIGSGLSMYQGTVAARTQLFGTTVCGNLPRNIIGRYQSDAATLVCDCAADVVFDGIVGGADLALVLDNWGIVSDPLQPTDIDGNGIVDAGDLTRVLASWGPCASE